MSTARGIFDHVATVRPVVHRQILRIIQPHYLEAILELFQHHLERSVPDLRRSVPDSSTKSVYPISV
ncbi:hypothetical protein TNCV_1178641 [Trichonephila clavipes]|nr:hypothetical protein TNCV_1178641 [Trichonephila clavipes]